MSKANSFEVVDCPVAELNGMALDYAVAIVEGGHSLEFDGITWAITLGHYIGGSDTRIIARVGNMAYQPAKNGNMVGR